MASSMVVVVVGNRKNVAPVSVVSGGRLLSAIVIRVTPLLRLFRIGEFALQLKLKLTQTNSSSMLACRLDQKTSRRPV